MLSNDVACPLQGSFHVGHLLRHKFLCGLHRIDVRREHELLCQRFESLLSRRFRPRFALRLEGQVDVFQHRGIPAFADALAQRIRQFALSFNRFEDIFAAMNEFAQLCVQVINLCHLHFVESASGFLAVA